MKNLNKLHINHEKLLNNVELIRMKGGNEQNWNFRCRCGFTPDYLSGCFCAPGPTVYDALHYAGFICDGQGATCDLTCPS